MNVNINEAGKDGFARGFDGFGVNSFGIGASAFLDCGDLSAANQHGTIFDHLAVADEDASAANQ